MRRGTIVARSTDMSIDDVPAVTDILDLDYVDHDTHIRSLIQVRQYIEPGVTFYDVSGSSYTLRLESELT